MLPFKLTRPAVNLDLEATTGDPKTARIVQISLEIFKPDGSREEHWSVIDPGVPIPQESSDVHGITEEVLRTCCARCKLLESEHKEDGDCTKFRVPPKFGQIAKLLFDKLTDVDYIGYNHRRFDLPLLEEEFRRYSLSFSWKESSTIDVFRLWQYIEPRTLKDAVEKYGDGKILEGAHDARNDTWGTLVALRGMYRAFPDLPDNVRDLHELLYPHDPNTIDHDRKFVFINEIPCFNFGKFKGLRINLTDKEHINYLKWMLNGQFSEETKRIARDMISGKLPEFQGNPAVSNPSSL